MSSGQRLYSAWATAIVLSVCCVPAAGATPKDSLQAAILEIRTDLDSASAYLDSAFVGHTPLHLEGLVPGSYRLTVLPPHPDEWSVRRIIDTVRLDPGILCARSYQLRSYVPLRSDPPGAEVYINDSLAGVTPLLLKPSSMGKDSRLTLKLNGFESASLPPGALSGESALTVALKAGWQAGPEGPSPFLPERPAWSSRSVGLYVSGGISVLAGIGAAYFKIAADDKQEAFLVTGDPALASERKRLDTWAGVSLALAQAGIMIFSYLLITE
jgi:hypothetical protein